ncbi:MAG TPA: response regulator [Candidatus Saccharimonadales bacterium]|nr:response regulator [Candidatus Saccharimonadales bacterium]
MAKILLVEDDNNLREIYEARLQAEGYDIVSARDGEEALVVAKAEKPDLVISDVMMPKISGFEMLDILRNTEGLRDVKVVMLTALGQTEDQQRANKLGADRYLVKSQVTLEDIVKAAHDLLGDEAATNAAKDDKLMNDAVNSLVSGTDDKAAGTDAPDAAKPAPAGAPAVSSAATDDSAAGDDDSGSNQVPVAHKKVIQPIDTGPSKDIHTLLAEEEAKEAKQAAGESALPDQAVQPEPVATAPEPTPEPAPEPTPAPAQAAAASDASDDAPSAAKEEATMDAKIEDFVAGASTEPTPPLAQPPAETSTSTPPASAPSVQPPVTPTPVAPAPAPQSTPTTAPPVPPAPSQPAATPASSTPAPASAPAQSKPDNQNPSSPPPDPNIIAL